MNISVLFHLLSLRDLFRGLILVFYLSAVIALKIHTSETKFCLREACNFVIKQVNTYYFFKNKCNSFFLLLGEVISLEEKLVSLVGESCFGLSTLQTRSSLLCLSSFFCFFRLLNCCHLTHLNSKSKMELN